MKEVPNFSTMLRMKIVNCPDILSIWSLKSKKSETIDGPQEKLSLCHLLMNNVSLKSKKRETIDGSQERLSLCNMLMNNVLFTMQNNL